MLMYMYCVTLSSQLALYSVCNFSLCVCVCDCAYMYMWEGRVTANEQNNGGKSCKGLSFPFANQCVCVCVYYRGGPLFCMKMS